MADVQFIDLDVSAFGFRSVHWLDGPSQLDSTSSDIAPQGDDKAPDYTAPFISVSKLREAAEEAWAETGSQEYLLPSDDDQLLRLLIGKLPVSALSKNTAWYEVGKHVANGVTWVASNVLPFSEWIMPTLVYGSLAVVGSAFFTAVGKPNYIPAVFAGALAAVILTDKSADPARAPALVGRRLSTIATALNGGVMPGAPSQVFARLRKARFTDASGKSDMYYFLEGDMPVVKAAGFLIPTDIVRIAGIPTLVLADAALNLDSLIEYCKEIGEGLTISTVDLQTGAVGTLSLTGKDNGLTVESLKALLPADVVAMIPGTLARDADGPLKLITRARGFYRNVETVKSYVKTPTGLVPEDDTFPDYKEGDIVKHDPELWARYIEESDLAVRENMNTLTDWAPYPAWNPAYLEFGVRKGGKLHYDVADQYQRWFPTPYPETPMQVAIAILRDAKGGQGPLPRPVEYVSYLEIQKSKKGNDGSIGARQQVPRWLNMYY